MTADPANRIELTDYLTESERKVLSDDRTREVGGIVVGMAEVYQRLGAEDVAPLAQELRDLISDMNIHELKRLRKAFGRANALLGRPDEEQPSLDSGAPHPHFHLAETTPLEKAAEAGKNLLSEEPDPAPSDLSEPADSSSPEIVTLDTAPVSPQLSQAAVAEAAEQETIGNFSLRKAKQLYKRINKFAGHDVLPPEPFDEGEIEGIVALYQQVFKSKAKSKNAADKLLAILEGQDYTTIATEYGGAEGSLQTSFSTGIPQTLAKAIVKLYEIDLAELEDSEETKPVKTDEPLIVAAEPTAPAAEVKQPVALVTQQESPLLDLSQPTTRSTPPTPTRQQPAIPAAERPIGEEPEHVQLAELFAEVFDFDGAEKAGFKSMLDPTQRSGFYSPSKKLAIEKINSAVVEAFGPKMEAAGLDRAQLYRVRSFLGIFFDVARQAPSYKEPVTLNEMRQQFQRDGHKPHQASEALFSGLRQLLAALEQSRSAGSASAS